MSMADFGSIAETGAKEGDFVLCTKNREAVEGQNFTVGSRYKVVRFGSQLCAAPNSTQAIGTRIPRAGYGSRWKLAEATS